MQTAEAKVSFKLLPQIWIADISSEIYFDKILPKNSEHGKISSLNVRPICPTRWVLRYPAVNAVLENYEDLLDFLSISRDN